MKVGFGVTVSAYGMQENKLDGIGHYTQEIFRNLNRKLDARVPIIFGSNGANLFEDISVYRLGNYKYQALKSAVTPLAFSGSESLSKLIDIFHATDHYTPRFRGVPVVATLMDAIPLSHPQWARSRGRKLKNWLWRKSGHWADHVITISEYSRQQISHYFHIPESRITVTPLGVDERYFERIDAATSSLVAKKHELPENFFLVIGTLQPRKNVERIVLAHKALPDSIRAQYPLIIVGHQGWGCEALVAELQGCSPKGPVQWLRNVNDFDKRVMLQRATALVFPSLLEGFGLPVLEAFASQTPVVTSNTSSLHEVAADAAWQVNPLDVKAIAEAMVTLAREQTVASELVVKGLSRARLFTWASCADKTLDAYKKL
jgi:glycosyltransferase involved in cell wall biosynthesis